MTKKIIITTVITSILGVIVYLSFPKDMHQTPTSDLTEYPDIYLDGVSIQAFNEQGKLAYELRANEIEQFSAKDTMHFRNLRILVKQDDGEVWHMSAEEGAIQPESEQPTKILEPIHLRGTVNVYAGNVDNPTYVFQGADVTYDPRAKTVSSDMAIFVKAESSTYNASGFHFDLTTKELELSSTSDNQVEVRHEGNESQ